jgi:outer membrane lipoprotein-sorting protein
MSDAVRGRRRWLAGIVLLLLASRSAAGAGAPESDPQAMLRRADASRSALTQSIARVRATVVRQGKAAATQDFDLYVGEGGRALCVFRGGKQDGRRVLTVGDRVWLIVPGASKPIPLSANQRLLGGASLGDILRLPLAEEFSATARPGSEDMEGTRCRVLDLTAKSPKSPYAAGVLWVGARDGLPRRLRLQLSGGKLVKDVRYLAYGRQAGRDVLKKMELQDLLTRGREIGTTLEFLSIEHTRPDPSLFDPHLSH